MVKPRTSEKEAKWMVTGDCNCPLLSVGRSARPASDALASMVLMSRSTDTDLPLFRSNQTLCLYGSAITIDSLFEWYQPDAEQMVAKAFIRLSVFQIESHDFRDLPPPTAAWMAKQICVMRHF